MTNNDIGTLNGFITTFFLKNIQTNFKLYLSSIKDYSNHFTGIDKNKILTLVEHYIHYFLVLKIYISGTKKFTKQNQQES